MSKSSRRGSRAGKGGFHPPHCPNRQCAFYAPSPHWHVRRTGSFTRVSDHARFPKFLCLDCGRHFSSRTFSATYWLRHRKLLPQIANLSANGPGLRQVGRILGISHATVARHLARAGRHCLLVHREEMQAATLAEPLVVDGFETFEYSQYFPFHFNLSVGAQSWFLYHFTDSPLRRKGRMTDDQKQMRRILEAKLGRPDPKAVERGFLGALRPLLGRIPNVPRADRAEGGPGRPDRPQPRTLQLLTDDHHAYRTALSRIRWENPDLVVRHEITPSTRRRTTANPLFPVNLADALIRHSGANHKRETIAFSKRRQAAAERLAVFLVWRNYIKRRREKEAGKTAAMAAGLVDEPWTWRHVFRQRRFIRPDSLPRAWRDYYWRRVATPVLGPGQTTHNCKYAF